MLALVAGAAVRVEQYASNRSLWLDEANLSLNLIHRNLGQLAKPLDYEQGAPVGWLWIQRLVVVTFGSSEYALRAVPLLCGLGALIVLTAIARRAIGAWAGASAALMLGLAPAAVRYSSEVKQYSSDVLIAALLVLITLIVQERALAAKWLWAWAGFAALSPWLSHPALIVVPACAVGLGVDLIVRHKIAALPRLVAATTGWVISALLLYVVSLRALARDQFLRSYWATDMAPRRLSVHGYLSWLWHVLPALYRDPGHLGLPLLAIALTAAGFAVLLERRQITLAATLLTMAGLAIVAASLDHYPLGGRLALYLLVVVVLSMSAVVDWSATRLRHGGGLALVAVAVVLASAMSATASYARHPFATPDTRDVLRFVRDHRQPGDQVWVQWPEIANAQFYAPKLKVAADAYLGDGTGTGSGGCTGQTPAQASRGGGAWVVFGYKLSKAPTTERASIVATLDQEATLRAQVERGGAVAYLFEFAGPPHVAAPPFVPLQCLVVVPL